MAFDTGNFENNTYLSADPILADLLNPAAVEVASGAVVYYSGGQVAVQTIADFANNGQVWVVVGESNPTTDGDGNTYNGSVVAALVRRGDFVRLSCTGTISEGDIVSIADGGQVRVFQAGDAAIGYATKDSDDASKVTVHFTR